MVVRGIGDIEQGIPPRSAQRDDSSNNSSQGFFGNPNAAAVRSDGAPLLPSMSKMVFIDFKTRSFIFCLTLFQIFMFVITLIVGAVRGTGMFVPQNSSCGPDTDTLLRMGAMFRPALRNGALYRLVTPVLLHAGLSHIGTNLFFQVSTGCQFEKLWGTKRIACIYWITGIGASIMSGLFQSDFIVSVGASGALMGLLGAQIAFLAMNWTDFPDAKRMMFTVVMLVFINAMLGLSIDQIDNWAHLGGFLCGLLIGAALVKKYTWRGRERLISTICGFVGIGYFIIGLIGIFTFAS